MMATSMEDSGWRPSTVVAAESRDSQRKSRVDRARTEILSLIADENLVLGDQLPTEHTLAERYGFSRSTMREALRVLEQQGVVKAIQGKGRFVSDGDSLEVERPITKYESVTEMLESLGYTVSNIVIQVEEGQATAPEAEALELAVGDPVIRLVRIRCGNDQPLIYSVNVIPRNLLPGPIAYRDWGMSVTGALEAHGHQVISSIARISAQNVPADEAKRLKLDSFAPWLLIEGRCISVTGQRVLYALDYHRGDKIAYHVLRRR